VKDSIMSDQNFRTMIDTLVSRWREAWQATPPELRGVETAASLASFVAAEHVYGAQVGYRVGSLAAAHDPLSALSNSELEQLRVQVGYPPQWSRAHAVAALVSVIFPLGFRGVQEGQ
jgi:hypothetical protein